MSQEDEILALVRQEQGDDEAFMTGLVELARRDVQEVLDALLRAVLDALLRAGTSGQSIRVADYADLARLGRWLAAAAALVADHEREQA